MNIYIYIYIYIIIISFNEQISKTYGNNRKMI